MSGPKARDQLAPLSADDLRRLDLVFHPDSEGYDPENALFFGACASAAYYTKQTDRDWYPDLFVFYIPFFDKVERLKPNWRDTEGLVMTSDEAIVVSLCGTNAFGDWLTNFNMALDLEADCLIHRGFWRALEIVWKQISNAISESRRNAPDKPLWFCGHSLGGALAVIAALRCRHEGIHFSGAYTYGQPLVGEGQLGEAQKSVEASIFRFVNEGDVVPLIPFKTTKPLKRPRFVRGASGARRRITREPAEFAEIGQYLSFSKNGSLRYQHNAPTRKESAAKNVITALSKLKKKKLSVEHHDMKRYLERLAKWRAKTPLGM